MQQTNNAKAVDSNEIKNAETFSQSLGISEERNVMLVDTVIRALEQMIASNIEINKSSALKYCAKELPEMTLEETLYIGHVIQLKAEALAKMVILEKLMKKMDKSENALDALASLLS